MVGRAGGQRRTASARAASGRTNPGRAAADGRASSDNRRRFERVERRNTRRADADGRSGARAATNCVGASASGDARRESAQGVVFGDQPRSMSASRTRRRRSNPSRPTVLLAHSHHSPAETGEIVEPLDVTGELALVGAVLFAVVLENHPPAPVHQIAECDEAPVFVQDAPVDLRFRKAEVRSSEPQFRLPDRVGPWSHERQRLPQSRHPSPANPALNGCFELFERRDRALPPRQRIADHHKLVHGQFRGELAPGVHRMDCGYPPDDPEPQRIGGCFVSTHSPAPGSPHRPHGRDVDRIRQSRRHRNSGECEGAPVAEELAHPQLDGVDPCAARDVERSRPGAHTVERRLEIAPAQTTPGHASGERAGDRERVGRQLIRQRAWSKHPPW